jgi:hypothetical protein
MTSRITKIVAASLLCSAAMIPSAMAQEAEAPAGGAAGEVEAPLGGAAGQAGTLAEGAAGEVEAAGVGAAGAECDELRVLVDENAGVIEQGWLDQAGES